MTASRLPRLPLNPIIEQYLVRPPGELAQLPVLGPRFTAIAAAQDWLQPAFLDRASDADLAEQLGPFYQAVVPIPCHGGTLSRRIGFIRHGLTHLLRGRDPLPARLGHCLDLDGPYAVAGLGPSFWSAVVQSQDLERSPGWWPDTIAGFRRLQPSRFPAGSAASCYAELLNWYEHVRAHWPNLTAQHLDHLLLLVARLPGRDLTLAEVDDPASQLTALIQSRAPLRDRLKRFGPSEPVRPLAVTLCDGVILPGSETELADEVAKWLGERFRLQDWEISELFRLWAERGEPAGRSARFTGFCRDSFDFLALLARNNRRDWFASHRGRYHFAVAGPLRDLAAALVEQYVAPVLIDRHGWKLETDLRPGRVLSRLVRNAFGRDRPYNEDLWIAFHRLGQGKRGQVQLFVRLSAAGLSYGLRLGPEGRTSGQEFRDRVTLHADRVTAALVASGAADLCQFRLDEAAEPITVSRAAQLQAWIAGPAPMAERCLPADAPILRSPDLVGEILLTLDRLLPLFACALVDDPEPFLNERLGLVGSEPTVSPVEFQRQTYLPDTWLERARDLLELKRQLILQGVPGTGKTHVARSLARLITAGHGDAVHLVQFHPAYSYEEFVEGIKARSVERDGRVNLSYPVENGILCEVAARAAAQPTHPHVLIIDEINRGNLPRIFGELLFLLEYRDQAVGLPYSRKSFRLPTNLYLIGTMNAADRSTVGIDQALRRRFSFLEMQPDAGVLAAWLRDHPPSAGDDFAQTIVALFEGLNLRLREDLGPRHQIGHSYFMVPNLDETRLRIVWKHHIMPLLDEYLAGQPSRLERYDLERLLKGPRRRGRSHVAERIASDPERPLP